MAVTVGDDVRALVDPVVARHQLCVYDVEHAGSVIRVLVERPGADVDLDALAALTRDLSAELDRTDPVPGRYTLEVSSPGLERSLRRPEHFAGAVGATVAVRLSGVEGDDTPRRVTGTLTAADDDGIVVDGRSIPYDRVDRARTTFDWGPSPKPGGGSRRKKRSRR